MGINTNYLKNITAKLFDCLISLSASSTCGTRYLEKLQISLSCLALSGL